MFKIPDSVINAIITIGIITVFLLVLIYIIRLFFYLILFILSFFYKRNKINNKKIVPKTEVIPYKKEEDEVFYTQHNDNYVRVS